MNIEEMNLSLEERVELEEEYRSKLREFLQPGALVGIRERHRRGKAYGIGMIGRKANAADFARYFGWNESNEPWYLCLFSEQCDLFHFSWLTIIKPAEGFPQDTPLPVDPFSDEP